ncbi:MAG: acyl-CoA dehydrogenase family protein [Flavobacteriales bacterium]|nr:acyl-CoA dehydrogenase family protein [Flavobacteriales bacterium]
MSWNTLADHPRLLLFVPSLLLAWDDAALTSEESDALGQLIGADGPLTSAERRALEALADPASPPMMADVLRWRTALQRSEAVHFRDLGRSLALANGASGEDLAALLPLADALDELLGTLSSEAVRRFRNEHATRTAAQNTHASFSVAALTRELHGDQADLIERVLRVLDRPAFQVPPAVDLHAQREQVLRWCHELAAEGLGSMAYPREFGGVADMDGYFTVMETISLFDHSLAIKFGVQFGLWGMSVQALGSNYHHQRYLRDIGTLAAPGCFAMTETGHGSNVQGLRTTAMYLHDTREFEIHTPDADAQKEYIGNAAMHGRYATVFAKLIVNDVDHGINAFIVPLRDAKGDVLPGITIGDCGPKHGLNGVDNGTIRFDRVRIPKAEMLDAFAQVDDQGRFQSTIENPDRRFFTMLGTLVGGRIAVPRSALSAAKSGLAIAIRYGDQRRQFGPNGVAEIPILNYRAHQRRLIPALATTYALHFALRSMTTRFLAHDRSDETEGRRIEAQAAGLKAVATWHVSQTLQTCRECCGGKGYLSENRIEGLRRDVDIHTTFEGDNTVLLQLVGKSRLQRFRQVFGIGGPMALLRLALDKAGTGITEKNPLAVRNIDADHLADPEFHRNALRYREHQLLESAARRLQRLVKDGMDGFHAINVAQRHLIAMAEAYIDRIILDACHAKLAAVNDPELRRVLDKLIGLHALHTLERHAGWYLENGYMEPVKTKAIRRQVDQWCWELRQEAVPLVHAFGIPDRLLGAAVLG